jgi:6-phosphogluconolactonase
MSKCVAAIEDSPKPPPRRITLTFLVLNTLTRHVIFCGVGEAKSTVIRHTFSSMTRNEVRPNSILYRAVLCTPAPYPSGMVVPMTPESFDNALTWIVDVDAMNNVPVS